MQQAFTIAGTILEVEVPSKNSTLVVLASFFNPAETNFEVKSNVKVSGDGIEDDHPFKDEVANASSSN